MGSPGLNRYRNEVTFPSNSFTLCWTYDNNNDSDDGNDDNNDNDDDDDVDYYYHDNDSNNDDVINTLYTLISNSFMSICFPSGVFALRECDLEGDIDLEGDTVEA